MTWIGQGKKFQSKRFPIHSDKGLMLEMSALSSLLWPIYIINSGDNARLPYYTLPMVQHHSFIKNYPLYSSIWF